MSVNSSFHEVQFPTAIALGAVGGPVRRTEIVTMGSGFEQRNARWASSRRKYNVGYGVKTLDDLNEVLAFFEERRGQLFGFRYKDPLDHKSCKPSEEVSSLDQLIGIGDGSNPDFQLMKSYGQDENLWQRQINKPVESTVQIAVDEQLMTEGIDYALNLVTGKIIFEQNAIPQTGAKISAGYEFDVPVRFDTDEILVNLKTFLAGDIASIPLIEVLV